MIEGASQAISLGDLVAIATVVAAVVTALMVPFWISLSRARGALKAASDRYEAADQLQRLAGRSNMYGLCAISTAFESCSGLLHRLLLDRDGEIDVPAAIRHLRAVRFGIDRAAAEASVIFGPEADQLAALQQLTHRLGDEQTFTLLSDALRIGDLDALKAEALRRAVTQLSDRLSRERAATTRLAQ